MTVDEYIAALPAEVRVIYERILQVVRQVAPHASETLSYGMPCFVQHGPVVYVGAFKQHIGLYPPVHDAKLRRRLAPYAGEKGNLRFALNQPVPYKLIGDVVQARLREQAAVFRSKAPRASARQIAKT